MVDRIVLDTAFTVPANKNEILKELEETYGDVDRIIAEIVEIYGIAVICRKHKVIRVSDDLDCLDELQES